MELFLKESLKKFPEEFGGIPRGVAGGAPREVYGKVPKEISGELLNDPPQEDN